jgi:hypothetical protein
MRLWAALFLLWMTLPANAQAAFPCPTTTIGWALQWPGPITSIAYDSQDQLLFVIWNNTRAQAFDKVPTGIMVALSYTQNPSAIYYGSLVPAYHQILLSQKDNCPLSFEGGGHIWTD